MATPNKSPRPPSSTSVHPETAQHVKSGVPGEESSKANPGASRSDAQTGHDKDGNAEQARSAPEPPKR
ncbi:MAG TPA: hypothetical protein VI072_13730 [Polyangiaceae bacterium]